MSVRKEQVVFAVTLLVLGWLVWGAVGARDRRGQSSRRAEPPALARSPAPDLALSSPSSRGELRELFAPPSDTQPLPPLPLQPPPLAPLAMLRPPPAPGPGPRAYGKLLRTEPFQLPMADLFAAAAADEGPEEEIAPDTRAVADLSAEERAERIASYKRLYDWYRVVDVRFGRIQNPDRFSLSKRPAEDLLFVELDPRTGLPRLAGQGAAKIPRATVTEFGFADTPANQIEIRRAGFGDPLAATEYEEALSFARWCIEMRHESPRALDVAEEVFRRAMPVLAEDPAPRLGLARVLEAGFRLEEAHAEYEAMLAGTWARNPLVLARLAELEARLLLDERAEERLREAERYGRTQWAVQAAFGRFLAARGRAAEAVEHLRIANQYEPAGPENKQERARLRADMGAALLAAGELGEAAEWFEKARQADPAEQHAQAGLLAVAALAPGTRAKGATNATNAPAGRFW